MSPDTNTFAAWRTISARLQLYLSYPFVVQKARTGHFCLNTW